MQASLLARRPGICHTARAPLAVRVRPPGLRARCRQRWSSRAWCWRRSGAVGRCTTAVQGASLDTACSEAHKGCRAALRIACIKGLTDSRHCLLRRAHLDSWLACLCGATACSRLWMTPFPVLACDVLTLPQHPVCTQVGGALLYKVLKPQQPIPCASQLVACKASLLP